MAVTSMGPGVLTVPHYQTVEGVAPPGWEKTIKKMKKSGDIDNPWALSWYMRNRGMKPARHEEDAAYDATIAAALKELQGRALPQVCVMAARGDQYAVNQCMQAGPMILEARARY